MPKFYASCTDIQIEVDAKGNLFHRDESDAELVMSYWNYGRVPLLEDSLFPVCGPAFAAKNGLCAHMAPDALAKALENLPLIGETVFPFGTRIDAWTYWAQKADLDPRGVVLRRHEMSHISLREAEMDLGVAMGCSSLCEDALRDGRLIMLPMRPTTGPYHFFLDCKSDTQAAKQVEAWLRAEALASMSGHPFAGRPGDHGLKGIDVNEWKFAAHFVLPMKIGSDTFATPARPNVWALPLPTRRAPAPKRPPKPGLGYHR